MQEKSLIKKNILQFLDYKGITKYKFYQETGISRNTLDQNNGMSEDGTSRFLACYPEVNAEWLITGQGSMLKTDTYNNVSPPPGAIESRQQPTTAGNSRQQPPAAPHECIYKELLKEKEAENKALNREIWERDKKIEVRDAKIEVLNSKLSGRDMQIEHLQEQLDTEKQKSEQAVKKSPKHYTIKDDPVNIAAEPLVEYSKQK